MCVFWDPIRSCRIQLRPGQGIARDSWCPAGVNRYRMVENPCNAPIRHPSSSVPTRPAAAMARTLTVRSVRCADILSRVFATTGASEAPGHILAMNPGLPVYLADSADSGTRRPSTASCSCRIPARRCGVIVRPTSSRAIAALHRSAGSHGGSRCARALVAASTPAAAWPHRG